MRRRRERRRGNLTARKNTCVNTISKIRPSIRPYQAGACEKVEAHKTVLDGRGMMDPDCHGQKSEAERQSKMGANGKMKMCVSRRPNTDKIGTYQADACKRLEGSAVGGKRDTGKRR